MTHLCHKPVGGGGRDSAVQQPILPPLGVISFEPSTEGLRAPHTSIQNDQVCLGGSPCSASGDASLSAFWAAQRRGRSRRARSRATACGASACSWRTTKTIPW